TRYGKSSFNNITCCRSLGRKIIINLISYQKLKKIIYMQSNEVLKAIQSRRSVFQANFTDQDVNKEDILTILDAANAAPTHKRTQPWRFTIFKGEGLVRLGTELSRIYKAVTPAEKYLEKTEITMGEKATQSKV